ncbi:solute carrier family 23 protein [Spiroplasma endosymbiont of Asaphidion curtum]|uniref:solute carrier family 23 protein n=1 Tax=Spiroplasma endosymbiont of Asaphidion curtum TaxID=3066281 RepID=UPI00313EC6DF
MIIIIGLLVAGIVINNSGLNPTNWASVKEVYPYWIAILIVGITLLAIISFNILCKDIFKVIPILLGMIVGYLVALIFHFSSSYQIINISLLTNVNNWSWHPWNKSVFKGIWNIDNKILVTAIFSLLPLIFITIAEHIGDHVNIGQITGNNYLKNPGYTGHC